MSIFNTLKSVATGGVSDFVSEAFETAKAYFPPDMTPQEEQSAKLAMENVALKRNQQIDDAINTAQGLMTEQISSLEGTANDLKSMGWAGYPIILLRGSQRPLWGAFCMYLDYSWLVKPTAKFSEQQQTAFIIINALVLGFLFGERAIKNLMPLITKMLQAKSV